MEEIERRSQAAERKDANTITLREALTALKQVAVPVKEKSRKIAPFWHDLHIQTIKKTETTARARRMWKIT